MPSIFLSHSSDDKQFTEGLASRLRAHGVEVWLDDMDLRIGDSLLQRIGDAIEAADYVGVIISRSSVQSGWVKHELQLAYSREIESQSVVVLPIMIERCRLPSYMRGKKYADFTNASAADESFAKLLLAIQNGSRERSGNDAALPVYAGHVPRSRVRLFALATIALSSLGLTLWWATPPLAYWQSSLRSKPTSSGNTGYVREIRSVGTAEIRDTLVWQFALTQRPTCSRVRILQPVNVGDWEPRPIALRSPLDPSFRDFLITVFPPGRVATVGVILEGSPPRDCLRLGFLRSSGKSPVSVMGGPLAIAHIRTNRALLFLALFTTGVIVVLVVSTLWSRIETMVRGGPR